MSRERMIEVMQTELGKLNQQIDLKIIRGRAYQREAKRHKFILRQLSVLAC